MAQILVTKPGILNQRDKALLRKSGVAAIEAENPSDVRLLDVSGGALIGDEMTLAVLKALSGDAIYASGLREALPEILLDMLSAKFASLSAE